LTPRQKFSHVLARQWPKCNQYVPEPGAKGMSVIDNIMTARNLKDR
jgi:hypothetical protein